MSCARRWRWSLGAGLRIASAAFLWISIEAAVATGGPIARASPLMHPSLPTNGGVYLPTLLQPALPIQPDRLHPGLQLSAFASPAGEKPNAPPISTPVHKKKWFFAGAAIHAAKAVVLLVSDGGDEERPVEDRTLPGFPPHPDAPRLAAMGGAFTQAFDRGGER